MLPDTTFKTLTLAVATYIVFFSYSVTKNPVLECILTILLMVNLSILTYATSQNDFKEVYFRQEIYDDAAMNGDDDCECETPRTEGDEDMLDTEPETEQEQEQEQERIACQPVLYLEELTDVQGDPDWRAYIYYDERIRRYVLKGTRRSLRATSRKTVYPEVKICFRSSRELASFLCSSTETVNVSMFAMAGATVKDATFAELYALPARGCRTELFGYDQTRPRYSTFVNYLRMVRDVDASHSNFAAF